MLQYNVTLAIKRVKLYREKRYIKNKVRKKNLESRQVLDPKELKLLKRELWIRPLRFRISLQAYILYP